MRPGDRRARVILGATCSVDAIGTLQIAVQIARRRGADLYGLLVTDEAILAAASGPRARAVGFFGGQIAPITAERMLDAFRADARRFEQGLLRAAQAASVHAAFRQAQGRLATALDEGAGAGDLLVYGFARPERGADCVVLLSDGTAPAADLLELAAQLAAYPDRPLVVLAPPAGDAALKAALAAHAPAVSHAPVLVPVADMSALLAQLERRRPAAVIAAAPRAALPPVGRLLDAARCPVIFPADPSAAISAPNTAQNAAPSDRAGS